MLVLELNRGRRYSDDVPVQDYVIFVVEFPMRFEPKGSAWPISATHKARHYTVFSIV